MSFEKAIPPYSRDHLESIKIMVLSKTNTDTLCLDTRPDASVVPLWMRKATYRYNLWTGMYMLEPHERHTLNVFFSILAFFGSVYTYVFWKGFFDGFSTADDSN